MPASRFLASLLARADVKIDGDRPQDIVVHDKRLFRKVILLGSLGLGEAYMDGWWDGRSLDAFFANVIGARLDKIVRLTPPSLGAIAGAYLFNPQSKNRAFEIGEAHYDIGNDLYRAMLDTRMAYTCGYWKDATTLDDAEEAKLDLVCRKIGLKKGDRVLDIGCGWGSFAKFAAEKYGASVVGITVSKEQVTLGNKRCAGLPVEIRAQDYRDINEQFDHIVSLGMFEHVGMKNYHDYFEVVRRCLRDNGLFLLHTIGQDTSLRVSDPWISKYIFPGGIVPSAAHITSAVERHFVLEDWHNFGADYDKTLMAWFSNFDAAWPQLRDRYDDRFYRMWKYYLLSCAGAFRARKTIQLWQIVLSKNGVPGGYKSVR